ncbi:carbon-nitrogen hydrolase family protein [Nitratiruptor sp. SB155-2]|uniref:carbon-nitrogen hydrolase family protein n=1 Tax=Nitratiruptor sp. (strain SB155-2) TaxID=387092 RepID=UPI0001587227|nr:carbon-nitrogen hydrolase family protein [Nitratiruptor sp. SB155-2]BAF70382.1 hydrolase, carbon-nitrogen family [Nitratiruptor sp. SB155-2]
MNIAALQIASVGMSPNRLDFYMRIAKENGVRLLALPEYVLNPFFHELRSIPKSMIQQQSKTQLEHLKQFAKTYDMTIVAPIVRVDKEGIKKSVAIVRPERMQYYNQQILINYPHWNEEVFFANEKEILQNAPVVRIDEIKIAVLPGFEVHFDRFWQEFMKRGVDAVIVPSISTFESKERWNNLLKMRAFTNHCYVIRVNRIGEYKDEKSNRWRFYGGSVSFDPEGNLSVELGENEELLIEHIQKPKIKEARKMWGFRSALQKRSAL